jgi:hypothetical protein
VRFVRHLAAFRYATKCGTAGVRHAQPTPANARGWPATWRGGTAGTHPLALCTTPPATTALRHGRRRKPRRGATLARRVRRRSTSWFVLPSCSGDLPAPSRILASGRVSPAFAQRRQNEKGPGVSAGASFIPEGM